MGELDADTDRQLSWREARLQKFGTGNFHERDHLGGGKNASPGSSGNARSRPGFLSSEAVLAD